MCDDYEDNDVNDVDEDTEDIEEYDPAEYWQSRGCGIYSVRLKVNSDEEHLLKKMKTNDC